MNEVYFVERKQGNVIVSIMHCRIDNKYHFVNLSKSHICTCAFNSIKDAINDMVKLKRLKKIINYYKIN